jgi:two-component system, response regulator PdtaR
LTKIPNLIDKDLNILLVEDEIILAMGMKCTLNDFGYKVSGIEVTGKNAIKHVKDKMPNLIIMDINLKGSITGINAAKHIWDNYKIPIIFLSSYSDKQTIVEAMSSEPYAYLIKPCKDEELIATITTTVHKHNYFFKNKILIQKEKKNIIYIDDNFFFNKTKNILYKDRVALNLTGNEIKLLEILSDFKGEPVSFETIQDFIWQDDFIDISSLRTLIYRLKVKLGINIIENIFEVGYKLKIK